MFSKNLKYLRQRTKISQQVLAMALDIPRTTLGDYERGKTEPNLQMLVKIADYFDVKLDDLIRSNLSHRDYEILKNKDLRVLAISVDRQNRGNIELVETKAEAGYLTSFQDPEFIGELPKIHFPNIPAGTFRGFEIQGDSMLPVEPGAIVICSYIESLAEIKDNKTYVVVSERDGVVYKRVRADRTKQSLIMVSDNELYLPFELPYEDVQEVWQYYAHLSFTDSNSIFKDMLREKIDDIQRKVTAINDKLLPS